MLAVVKTFTKNSVEFSKIAGTEPLLALPDPDEGKKKKKKKKFVDPNAPKKPHSAYVQYLQDTRAQIVKENPDLKQTEIMAKIGNLWTNLPEKTKKKYASNYDRELKKYEAEFAAYKKKNPHAVEPPSPKKKPKKEKKSTPARKSAIGKKRKSPRGGSSKSKKRK